jgi:hypothetical protein
MSDLLTKKSKKPSRSIIGLYTKKAINVFNISCALLYRHCNCLYPFFLSPKYFKNTI